MAPGTRQARDGAALAAPQYWHAGLEAGHWDIPGVHTPTAATTPIAAARATCVRSWRDGRRRFRHARA
jgi:hypothetical protein